MTAAYIHCEADRIDDFAYRNRQIGASLLSEIRNCAEIVAVRIGAENADIALTAVKNYLFLADRDAFYLLRFPGSDARFKAEFNEEFDINLVKAAVKLNRLDGKRRPYDIGFLNAYAAGFFDYFLTETGKKNPNVLKTIFIAACVKNSTTIYANVVAAEKSAVIITAKTSVFSHKLQTPYSIFNNGEWFASNFAFISGIRRPNMTYASPNTPYVNIVCGALYFGFKKLLLCRFNKYTEMKYIPAYCGLYMNVRFI